jgi:CHASE2 domain-containing sensor protein
MRKLVRSFVDTVTAVTICLACLLQCRLSMRKLVRSFVDTVMAVTICLACLLHCSMSMSG